MIQKLEFGRTGHLSTRTLFGAAALGRVTQAEADATLDVLLKYGVNHIDTAASYGDAELRIGPWMPKHRDHFFLATKTEERTYTKARESIHRSLERLQTDHLDLLQLHAVIEDEEWATALGADGALRAAVEARDEGLVRFIGITSHSLRAPMMHKKSLEQFDFDSILLPCNYMLMQNPQYAAEFNEVVALCHSRKVAVQMIKTNQYRPWGERPRAYATWYEPFDQQPLVDLATHWALTRPNTFINTAGDIHILPLVLDAASRFDPANPPSDEQMQQLVAASEAAPLWA
jgi:aryl-alcohol dehydrogenase-like predicted oxidoreductase